MIQILIFSILAAIISAVPNPPAAKEATTLNLPDTAITTQFNSSRGRILIQEPKGGINFAALFTSVTRTLARYERLARYASGSSPDDSTLGKRQTTHLSDCVISGVDTGYAGDVTFGQTRFNTGQSGFNMLVDTGSADIVVPGPKCDAAAGCGNQARYGNTGQILNNGEEVEIEYNVDSGKGVLVADDVTLGSVTAPNTTILSLASSEGIGTSQFDGVFGMGGQELSIANTPTFFQNLITQKLVKAPEFGVSLGRTTSGTASKSFLTLGPTDPTVYNGPFADIPVYNSSGWKIPVASVTVNGKTIGAKPGVAGSSAGLATIDTGSTLMITSKANADAIFAAIPGAQPIALGGSGTQQAATQASDSAAAPSATSDAGSGQSYYYAIPCDLPRSYVPFFTFSVTGELPTGASTDQVSPPLQVHFRDFNLGSIAAASASAAGTQCAVDQNTLSLADKAQLCLSSIMGAGSGFDPEKGQSLYVLGDAWLKGRYTKFAYTDEGVPRYVGFGKTR